MVLPHPHNQPSRLSPHHAQRRCQAGQTVFSQDPTLRCGATTFKSRGATFTWSWQRFHGALRLLPLVEDLHRLLERLDFLRALLVFLLPILWLLDAHALELLQLRKRQFLLRLRILQLVLGVVELVREVRHLRLLLLLTLFLVCDVLFSLRLELLELLLGSLLLSGRRLNGPLEVADDDLEKPNNPLGCVLVPVIFALERRRRKVAHGLSVPARIRRGVLAGLLKEGVVVELLKRRERHLGCAEPSRGVRDRLHVLRLLVLPELRRLLERLVQLGNLLPQHLDLRSELLQLRFDVVDLRRVLLDVRRRAVAVPDGSRHLLVAEALRLGFRLRIGLELRDKILDHAADLDEVILLGPGLHRKGRELGAPEAQRCVLNEGQRAVQRLPSTLGSTAPLQERHRQADANGLGLLGRLSLLQFHELLVGVVVRLRTRLEFLYRRRNGRELGRPRLRTLVEQLGLVLAGFGKHVQECLVGLQVFLLLLQLGLGVGELVLLLTQELLRLRQLFL